MGGPPLLLGPGAGRRDFGNRIVFTALKDEVRAGKGLTGVKPPRRRKPLNGIVIKRRV